MDKAPQQLWAGHGAVAEHTNSKENTLQYTLDMDKAPQQPWDITTNQPGHSAVAGHTNTKGNSNQCTPLHTLCNNASHGQSFTKTVQQDNKLLKGGTP